MTPSFKTVELELAEKRLQQLEKSLSAHGGLRLPAWFPRLSVDVGADASRKEMTGETGSQKITLEPIDNPSRQLVELALHYLVNQPDQVWFHTQFQPMACELSDGQVRTFFDEGYSKPHVSEKKNNPRAASYASR